MRNAFILARKECLSFLRSWMGVFVFVFFYLITGIFFSFLVTGYGRISAEAAREGLEAIQGLGLTRFVFGSLFLNLSVILLFLVPAITMQAFAEERKMQTLELLYTYPFSDFEIVWGKFLGIFWVFLFLLLPTVVYLGILHRLGGELDWGPVLSGYLGFGLLACAYLSLGLFISSLTESQVVSAFATFALLIVLWMLDWASSLTDGYWAHFFKALSPLGHYREFTLGVVDLSHITYFVLFHFYFLFMTLRSVESRNWKA